MFVYTFPKKESVNLNLKKNCNTTHIIRDMFHLYVRIDIYIDSETNLKNNFRDSKQTRKLV